MIIASVVMIYEEQIEETNLMVLKRKLKTCSSFSSDPVKGFTSGVLPAICTRNTS
jgi:hypothetical protein